MLALDTSTEDMALAVLAGERPWTQLAPGGAQASATLVPLARALLQQAGCDWDSLGAIAFGRGPGAFTGLRTSCAVAQGLALGLDLPLLPLDSLMLVAEDLRAQACPPEADCPWTVGVAMDARMDEVYAGVYTWVPAPRHPCLAGPPDGGTPAGPQPPGHWQVRWPPALLTLPALSACWADAAGGTSSGPEPSGGSAPDAPPWQPGSAGAGGLVLQAIGGTALAVHGDRLALPAGVRQLPHQQDRGQALWRLALQARAQGDTVDAALALPLYLRDKVALTTAERSPRPVPA